MTSEFERFDGPHPPGVEPGPPFPPLPGSGELVVTDDADTPIGLVGWRPVPWGPNAGSVALDIGISLRPHARGQGHGARAHRLVVEWLLTTTAVHRLQASTDVRNVAEQKALRSAGFRAEGVARGAQWRAGEWHDLACFALLRSDREPPHRG